MVIRDVLQHKGSEVLAVESGAKVLEAVQLMVSHKVGAVLVRSGGKPVGIFTERDHLKATVNGSPDPSEAVIDDWMSKELVVGMPTDTVESAMAVMTEKRVRHLPIIDGHELVGMVSIGDVVKAIAEKQEVEIRYMKDYIEGQIS